MPLIKDARLRWILRCGWRGRCPRCGQGTLFAGWMTLAKACDHCGLDYGFAQTDDGPAFFALCLTALPLTFVAVWIEVAFEPPWWVHALTSVPILVGGCLGSLRPFKGWLLVSQWLNHDPAAAPGSGWSPPE